MWNSGKTEGTPTNSDKMRLLLAYLAANPGKLDQTVRAQWQEMSRITSIEMHAICNVRYLGVELIKAKSSTCPLLCFATHPSLTLLQNPNFSGI